jgi:hypothetical protein
MPLWAEIFLSFRLATPPGSFRFRPAKPTSPTSSLLPRSNSHQNPKPKPQTPSARARALTPPCLRHRSTRKRKTPPRRRRRQVCGAKRPGGRHFRQRLVLATLTSTAVTIEDIRSGDSARTRCGCSASSTRYPTTTPSTSTRRVRRCRPHPHPRELELVLLMLMDAR